MSYITLDCRDGVHAACVVCNCRCHGELVQEGHEFKEARLSIRDALRRLITKLDPHWCAIGWHAWGLKHEKGWGFTEVCRYCPTERSPY